MCENVHDWPFEQDAVQKEGGVLKLDPLAALFAQLVCMANQIASLSVQKSQNEHVASASSSHMPVEFWEETDYMNNWVSNFWGNQTQLLQTTTWG